MKKREKIAIFLAPIASGVLQSIVMGNLGSFLFGVIFSYIFSVIIGVPLLYILRRNRLEKLWHYMLAGVSGGLFVGAIMAIFFGFSDGYYSSLSISMAFLLLSFHGFFVSSIYWAIVFLKTKSFNVKA